MVVLTGTRLPETEFKQVWQQNSESKWAINLYYGKKNKCSNIASRIPVIMDKKCFKPEHLAHAWNPGAEIKGRGAAVRLKARWVDMAIIAGYCPTRPTKQAEVGKYEKTIVHLVGFLEAPWPNFHK